MILIWAWGTLHRHAKCMTQSTTPMTRQVLDLRVGDQEERVLVADALARPPP